MTMNEIITQFEYAAEDFNNEFDYNFDADNFVIQGINVGPDREKIFEDFCTKYFPFRLNDNYKCDEYYLFLASAFPGKKVTDKQGILVRTDIEWDEKKIYHIMLHELAHIYCVHNELDGKIFYDEYCEDYAKDMETDGQINAGYMVWREYIADMLTCECEDAEVSYLYEKFGVLSSLKRGIDRATGKVIISKILFEIMSSADVLKTNTWEEAKQSIIDLELFDFPAYIDMFELVFRKFKSGSIKIDIDFIMRLGFLYLEIVTFSDIVSAAQKLK